MLQLNGTSYDELRQLGAADRNARERLAARLGIMLRSGAPDELDDLLIPADTVTDRWLEEMFGLLDTSRDPLTEPEPAARMAPGRPACRLGSRGYSRRGWCRTNCSTRRSLATRTWSLRPISDRLSASGSRKWPDSVQPS